MESKYSEKYYSGHGYEHTNWIRDLARRIAPRYPKKLFQVAEQLEDHDLILDVGCGTGNILAKMNLFNNTFDLYGIDIGTYSDLPPFLKYCRSNASCLPFKDETFDFVILSHILEHLSDPHIAVLEAKRVLKPGGWLYIETPSVKTVFLPFKGNFFDDPTHIRPYTRRSLGGILDNLSFANIQTGTKRNFFVATFGIIYFLFRPFLKDPTGGFIVMSNLLGLQINVVGQKSKG